VSAASSRRRLNLPSTGSVLDEMYGSEPESEPVAEPAPTPDLQESTPAPTGVQHGSATGGTAVGQDPARDAAASARRRTGTSRTPEGRRRHTLYLAADVAAELDAAADEMVSGLHGMVPRHVVLGALIRAGLAKHDQVIAELRADLVRHLQP
jgi:hypothetical protein